MADTNLKVQDAPKEKKKRKSSVKKPDPAPEGGVPVAPNDPPSESPSDPPADQPPAPEGLTESAVPSEEQDGYREYAKPTTPKSRSVKEVEIELTNGHEEPTERKNSTPAAQTPKRRQSDMSHRGSRKSTHGSSANMLEDLDEEKLLELKEAFKLFDLNRDGFIDSVDLKLTYGTLGKTDVPDQQIKDMMAEASNPLDFDAFVMLLGFKTVALDPEEIMVAALAKWDVNNSGLISEEKIKHDLMSWGDKFTEEEVDIALEDAPKSDNFGNPLIDYVKFCKLLCGLRKKTREVTIEDFMS